MGVITSLFVLPLLSGVFVCMVRSTITHTFSSCIYRTRSRESIVHSSSHVAGRVPSSLPYPRVHQLCLCTHNESMDVVFVEERERGQWRSGEKVVEPPVGEEDYSCTREEGGVIRNDKSMINDYGRWTRERLNRNSRGREWQNNVRTIVRKLRITGKNDEKMQKRRGRCKQTLILTPLIEIIICSYTTRCHGVKASPFLRYHSFSAFL